MWSYKGQQLFEPPSGSYGFIYVITHIPTGKKYLGRRYLTKAGYKTVNKKRIKIRKPSDWQDYYSSSPELIAMVEREGKENFHREIVAFGYSRGHTNYLEVRYQFIFKVIESDQWMNSNISSKYFRKNVCKYVSQYPDSFNLEL